MRHLADFDKLPRKIKKSYLGHKLNKTKLRKLKSEVRIIQHKYPQESEILPYPFCPKCGCRVIEWSGNKASYPERWEQGVCARCGNFVCESDNSPYVHCLEIGVEGL
jgi:hypothetical protein